MNACYVLIAQGDSPQEVQDLRQAGEEDCQGPNGGTSTSAI